MNRLLSWACWVLVGAAPLLCEASGLVRSDNFVVGGPNEEIARAVLNRAEELRREIAIRWLGEELPPSVGPTIIHVQISESEEVNLAWVIDDRRRNYHTVWLKTTEKQATGGALAHELCHAILATRFPDPIPAWINEGIACQQDDEGRKTTRRRIINWYAKTGNWPSLPKLFIQKQLDTLDQASYATAESLVSFLLTRGNREKLLSCLIESKKVGWAEALHITYHINSVDELETAWRGWVRRELTATPPSSTQP